MYYTKTTREFYCIVNYKLLSEFDKVPNNEKLNWSSKRAVAHSLVNNKLYSKWLTLMKKNGLAADGTLLPKPGGWWHDAMDVKVVYNPKVKTLRYINRDANNLSSK